MIYRRRIRCVRQPKGRNASSSPWHDGTCQGAFCCDVSRGGCDLGDVCKAVQTRYIIACSAAHVGNAPCTCCALCDCCDFTGLQVLATGFATLTLALLISLIIAGHWLTVNGFTPLWSAFTFPLAASAAALLAQDETRMFQIAGAVVLIAATFAIPVILALVLRQWMTGQLPTILSAKST